MHTIVLLYINIIILKMEGLIRKINNLKFILAEKAPFRIDKR